MHFKLVVFLFECILLINFYVVDNFVHFFSSSKQTSARHRLCFINVEEILINNEQSNMSTAATTGQPDVETFELLLQSVDASSKFESWTQLLAEAERCSQAAPACATKRSIDSWLCILTATATGSNLQSS